MEEMGLLSAFLVQLGAPMQWAGLQTPTGVAAHERVNPPCMHLVSLLCYYTCPTIILLPTNLALSIISGSVAETIPLQVPAILNDFYRPVPKQNGIFKLQIRACTDFVNSNFNRVFLSTAHFNHGYLTNDNLATEQPILIP